MTDTETVSPGLNDGRSSLSCDFSKSLTIEAGDFSTSEITGAEHICKKRAINEEIGDKWYKMWEAYQNDVIEQFKTDDLSDSQPTKGNIEGGLTTIEEKALGNLEKIGITSIY